ncbi:MAG: DUF883 family protein [Verrucomicrobiota bacterium]
MTEDNSTPQREKLVTDFKKLVASAQEMLKATSTNVGERASEARAHLESNLKEARNRIAVAEAMVRDRTKEYAEVTDTFVRDQPWKAIGIAAGVGLLLGLLCAPRGRRE